MTKKDYELIASTIMGECFTGYDRTEPDFSLVDGVDYDTVAGISTAIADALATQDNNFKRDVFLKDCGIDQ